MKIIHIILGLGTAIIVGALINLGIKAFHPEPISPYENYYPKAPMMAPPDLPCAKDDTACIAKRDAYYGEQQKENDLQQAKQQDYDNAMRAYNSDLFIIANLAGIAVF